VQYAVSETKDMGTRWERTGILVRVTQCLVLEDNKKDLKVIAYLWSIPINSFEILVTNFQGELQLHQPAEALLLH
jgi:hypothetical protein